MNTKLCPKCKEDKPLNAFAKNKKRSDGLQVHCRLCKKLSDAKHYQENKSAQMERNRINRAKFYEEIAAYKKSKGCKFCEESEPCCLDFHHRSGKEKDGTIGKMMYNLNKKLVWKEIAKCEVVCANCHRKLHAGKLAS